jgi:hypothetical protein
MLQTRVKLLICHINLDWRGSKTKPFGGLILVPTGRPFKAVKKARNAPLYYPQL